MVYVSMLCFIYLSQLSKSKQLEPSKRVSCMSWIKHYFKVYFYFKLKSDSRRGKNWKAFQYNSPYTFHRNQWQPNMRFLQIPTGLAILRDTSDFTALLKGLMFILLYEGYFTSLLITSGLGLGCFPFTSTKHPSHEACVNRADFTKWLGK